MDVVLAFRMGWKARWLIAVVVCCIALTGCSLDDLQPWVEDLQELISPAPSPSPAAPPTASPTPTPTPEPTATPASSGLVLRFWVPDVLATSTGSGQGSAVPAGPATVSEAPGVAVLREQVDEFVGMSSDLQVEMLVKKATGPGGLYDLLSTASGVAPSVVPDLLILGRQDLLAAAGEGFIQPLDDYLPSDAGYFSAALDDVGTSEALWAFPYLATAEQMAYRATVTITAPITWTGVLSNGFSMLLPGAATEGAASDMLLAMYIGAGGRTVDPVGQTTLNRPVLEQVYGFLIEALNAGLLVPEQVLGLGDTAACWEAYQQGNADLTPVSLGTYWRAHLATPADDATPTPTPETEGETDGPPPVAALPADTLPTWVPTVSGAPITVMRTWGLAIVTQDPTRREMALELLRWLVSARQMGDLTRAAGLTPTRRQAVEAWGLASEDQDFVLQVLSNSVAAPTAGADVVVRRALQAGLVAILQGEATTADAAASQALTNLRR